MQDTLGPANSVALPQPLIDGVKPVGAGVGIGVGGVGLAVGVGVGLGVGLAVGFGVGGVGVDVGLAVGFGVGNVMSVKVTSNIPPEIAVFPSCVSNLPSEIVRVTRASARYGEHMSTAEVAAALRAGTVTSGDVASWNKDVCRKACDALDLSSAGKVEALRERIVAAMEKETSEAKK